MAIYIGGGNDDRDAVLFIPSICEKESFSFLSTLFLNKQDSDKIPNDYSLKCNTSKSDQKYKDLIGNSFCGNPVQAIKPLCTGKPSHSGISKCIRNDTSDAYRENPMMWSLF